MPRLFGRRHSRLAAIGARRKGLAAGRSLGYRLYRGHPTCRRYSQILASSRTIAGVSLKRIVMDKVMGAALLVHERHDFLADGFDRPQAEAVPPHATALAQEVWLYAFTLMLLR